MFKSMFKLQFLFKFTLAGILRKLYSKVTYYRKSNPMPGANIFHNALPNISCLILLVKFS